MAIINEIEQIASDIDYAIDMLEQGEFYEDIVPDLKDASKRLDDVSVEIYSLSQEINVIRGKLEG